MKKETRIKKIEKIVYTSLQSLFQSIEEMPLDKFVIVVLECLMLLEREEYLKSSKGEDDSGNGSYLRSFRSLRINSLQINIPRSRKGSFKPITMELLLQQKEQVYELALLLYRKGMSTRDIAEVMKEFFGESLNRTTVCSLAESFHEVRKEWEKTPLDAYYKVIYCDALYTTVKRGDSYSKEALHVIYGVKEDNTRELLLLEVNPTEGSSNWGEYFDKLKKRGVEQIGLIVADGLPYLEDEVAKHFIGAKFQKCVVHLQRNLLNKVRPKDKKEFSEDLRQVFSNFESTSTKEKAYQKIELFVGKWKSMYPKLVPKLADKDYIKHYLTYIDFSVEIRRMIYTTNSIENLNRQIRKVTKTKVTFEKIENLLDLVFMVIKDFEHNNWQKYAVNQFRFL